LEGVATAIAGQDPETVELGLLSRQEIPHELGDVAFELPLNQRSQPIRSPLGWHILRVVKIEPAATQSFDAVKSQIATELKRQKAADRLDKIGNQADDALAGGARSPMSPRNSSSKRRRSRHPTTAVTTARHGDHRCPSHPTRSSRPSSRPARATPAGSWT